MIAPSTMTLNAPDSTTDQGLPNDIQPMPGTPFGILIISALGWLLVITGLIALPWPLPGASPTPDGSHLIRFATSIPGETPPAAIIRHGLDILPYAIIVIVPLCMILATGWRRARLAVRLLTIFGILGILYAIGAALQFGPMVFIVGCIMIAVSGWLGWSLPAVDPEPFMTHSVHEPMAVPLDPIDAADDADNPIASEADPSLVSSAPDEIRETRTL